MKAIWIWENGQENADEYADFMASFSLENLDEPVNLRLSADSNYAVYVNGKLAAFGQYADFPHCKVADTHDITAYCHAGENTVLFTVWYYGVASATYFKGSAGLYFEISQGNELLSVSGTDTLSRKNPYFVPYCKKTITKEQGFSFRYNGAGVETPYHNSIATGYDPELHPRPIKTLELWDLCPGKVIDGNGATYFVLDLGREEVGYIDLDIYSETEQHILIAYAEHMNEGKVNYRLGARDFSVEYDTKVGENTYLNPFRRLACRYLAVYSEQPIEIRHIGIRPVMYPVTELPFDAGSPRRQRIYEVAKRTLHLCMHEHHEDCPWREQALYAMDSRNQMLCGYYAFGETQFARASLWLFAQDRREDGLLADCAPSAHRQVIPSFCLHWYQEVLEYTEFTGDLTLAKEIWGKLCSVLDAFMPYYDHGRNLLNCLPRDEYWNFYEWSGKYMMGQNRVNDEPDLILNCLFLRALENMAKLAEMTGQAFALASMKEDLRVSIRKHFRRPDGLYQTNLDGTHICDLGNALAILTGVAEEKDHALICRVLTDTESELNVEHIVLDQGFLGGTCDTNESGSEITRIIPISVSMTTFVYDALLRVDADRYKDYILNDIDTRYSTMLDAGATTFWETMGGYVSFAKAGSLCHGWSALAIYYYHKLL